MNTLLNIFSPTIVAGLPDETIRSITEESQDRVQERHNLEEQIAALSKAEELLRRACSKINGSAAF